VELLRSGYDALSRGDVAAWVSTFDREVELHEIPSMPGATVHHGHRGVRRWLKGMVQLTGERPRIEPEEFIETLDCVVARVRAHARSRVGDVPVEIRMVHVVEIDHGRIRRLRAFVEESDALEAAGLLAR
jgi:ketosteroid isomerase-like protein